MPITTPWKIAGVATMALGAITGAAVGSGGIELRDRTEAIDLAGSTVDHTDLNLGAVDASPESADSPAESPFDSPESPSDSPDDPQYVDASPESADSPAESPADSPADPPAPSVRFGGGDDSPGSAASADSPGSAGSANSPD